MEINIKKIVACGLFVAISMIGANIKIFFSIAFDSFAAMLAGLLLGPIYGGIVALIGHMLTAITSNFPYGLPVHLITAVFMFLAVFFFTNVYKIIFNKFKNRYIALLVADLIGIIINVPLSLLVLSPLLTISGSISIFVPLLLASIANFILSNIIFINLEGKINVN